MLNGGQLTATFYVDLTGPVPKRQKTVLTGYNEQYLRRMLLAGKIISIKIGQVQLIDMLCLQAQLDHAKEGNDRRFGAQ